MQMQEKIENWIKEALKIKEGFVVEHPADLNNGDYSTNAAMVMAGKKRKNPKELAKEFGRTLSENKIPEIEKIEAVGGFINFYLSKGFLAEKVKEAGDGEDFGKTELLVKPAEGAPEDAGGPEVKLKEPMKILIEHTQPNPFKEFHIGHLMNNAIGESLTRILKANGAEVTASWRHARPLGHARRQRRMLVSRS
jgi:arginyl-tRNA synthetase